jgi:hypothetical protein
MQAGRHSSLAWIRTPAESHEVCGFYANAIVAGWRGAVTSSSGLATRAESCCLNGDFSRDAGAKRLGGGPSSGNDRSYCADKGTQLKGGADSATLSSSLELLYLLVGFPVDLIELGTGVVDQLSDFIDDRRHALVQVRLIHHGHGVTHVHAVHAIHHVTGVVWIESIGRSADARGGVAIRVRLLVYGVRDVRPGVRRCRRPQAAENRRRTLSRGHSWPCTDCYQLTPKSWQILNGPPYAARLSDHVASSYDFEGPTRTFQTSSWRSSMKR